MVFEDDQEGLGAQFVWRTTDNLLTLERDVAAGQSSARLVYDRDEDSFEMKIPKVQADNISSPTGHVLHVRNTNADVRGDVLALSVGATSPGAGNNFITFFKGGGPQRSGRISPILPGPESPFPRVPPITRICCPFFSHSPASVGPLIQAEWQPGSRLRPPRPSWRPQR